jgi:hypothetical protein
MGFHAPASPTLLGFLCFIGALGVTLLGLAGEFPRFLLTQDLALACDLAPPFVCGTQLLVVIESERDRERGRAEVFCVSKK